MIEPESYILLLSGGIDSVTLLHESLIAGRRIHALTINYGQLHDEEIKYARLHARKTNTPHTVVDLFKTGPCGVFRHSLLTDGGKSPVVPNRNAVLLNIAAAFAVSNGGDVVLIGCNKDDREVFKDCTLDFLMAINKCLDAAELPVHVAAPYIYKRKSEIVRYALEIGVDLSSTWSCYSPKQGTHGAVPCGTCLACKMRMEALTTPAPRAA